MFHLSDPRAHRYLPVSHASSHGNLHMHLQQQHANMTNGSSRSTLSSFANDYPTYKLDRNGVEQMVAATKETKSLMFDNLCLVAMRLLPFCLSDRLKSMFQGCVNAAFKLRQK